MKSCLKYFKGYIRECILGPLFKLLEATFELFVPTVITAIIDIGIAGNDKNYIVSRIFILVALAVIGLVCSLTAQYFSAKAATGFAAKIRSAMFKRVQTFSYSEIDKIGTATIINRMTSDVNQLQSGVNMTLRLFLRSPFIVFGAMIMAFTINRKISLIFLVVIVLLSIVVYGIMIITIPKQSAVQKGLDRVLTRTRDNLSGVRVIRAFGKEEGEQEAFKNDNDILTKMQIITGQISALTNPITFIIVNLGIVYLMYRGAINVSLEILTPGQVVALLNYMSQILVELIKLAGFILLDIKAFAAAKRIEEVLNIQSTMEEGTEVIASGSKALSVRFEDVSLKYGESKEDSVYGVTFEAKPGDTIGIIGGTGSGKSSIINLIPRFYDATNGKVFIDEKNVKEYTFESLRQAIGVTPQKAVLFSGSIRDNMKWGNENATDEEIWEALKNAMAYDFVIEKEGKLDYMITKGGKNLSGGQRQRLTIARALVSKPGILILDDSASALDALTDANLRKRLREMDNAPTVFIVSQRSASIMQADKIIVLDDGKVSGIGTHQELLDNCDVYREIHESQFGGNHG